MKRSGRVTFVIAMQLIYAMTLTSLSLYLLVLSLSQFWKTRAGPFRGDAAINLMIPSAILAGPALVTLMGWLGLRKEKLWGWWLALIGDAGMLGLLVYILIDDGWENFDWYMVALTVASAMVTILLLAPIVRKFYWHVAKLQSVDLTS